MSSACIVNYNFQPDDWWLEYGITDAVMYDRSDDGIQRTFAAKTYQTPNMGNVDADKLGDLIENYDNLPDLFFWGKSNITKYCPKDELDELMKRDTFTPILTKTHKTYSDRFGVVCRYQGEMYEERADSWIFNNPDLSTRFRSWDEWCSEFGLPRTSFIPFSPGGNYLLTRERVHRYGVDFYDHMRSTMLYSRNPAEAHAAERSYFLLWK